MPLEISKIGVRMAVGDGKATTAPVTTPTEEPVTAAQRENMIQACVRRVLQALRMGSAR